MLDDGIRTRAIHASIPFDQTSAVSPPIWQTSTFRAAPERFAELAQTAKPAEYYTRYGNPTHAQIEAVLASLEGGESAHVTGCGMGAIFTTVLALLDRGDHVVAQRNLYAGTASLLETVLPRWGMETTFVDQRDPGAFEAALRPETKLIYVETPANPLMHLTDLAAVAAIAKRHGILTVCDNTFATPVNQRPIEHGIDLVVHSATKYLGGHSDVTAGAVIGPRALMERIWRFHIIAGSSLAPLEGWLLLRGLRTLALRVEQHNRNAAAVARFLERDPRIRRVYYSGLDSHPQRELARRQMSGFTGMMSVEIDGSYEDAKRFLGSLRLASYAASLGGVETLVVHPAAMWAEEITPAQREAMGVSDSLVRISIGLEDEGDLIADLRQALDAMAARA